MSIDEEFTIYEEGVREDIAHVMGILREPLSDQPEELVSDLTDAEAWTARIGLILADANSFLDRVKILKLPKRDFGTDLDRKTKMDADIAPYRKFRDHMETLADSLKNRLVSGMSILGYYRATTEARVHYPAGQTPQGAMRAKKLSDILK